MGSSDPQRDELARAANYYGEQAARAYLDGAYEYALKAADLAIENLRKLVRLGGPELPKVIDVLADALRDRAEIISVFVSHGKLYQQAVRDAEEGIELYRKHGGANGRPAPLWIASVQILLAELLVGSGEAEHAAQAATAALADYRKHTTPDERSQTGLAHALSRYANVMAATGAAEAALAARRESVLLYRPWLVETSELWRYRFDRSLTWASTPTLERASRTACDLAWQLEPPDNAPEALAALQDAAEGIASLIRTLFDQPEMMTVRQIMLRIVEWLTAIDAHETADAYLEMTQNVTNVGSLRPLLAPYLGSTGT